MYLIIQLNLNYFMEAKFEVTFQEINFYPTHDI